MPKKKEKDVDVVESENVVAKVESEVVAKVEAEVAATAAPVGGTKGRYQVVSGKDVLFTTDDLLQAKQFAQKSPGKLVA